MFNPLTFGLHISQVNDIRKGTVLSHNGKRLQVLGSAEWCPKPKAIHVPVKGHAPGVSKSKGNNKGTDFLTIPFDNDGNSFDDYEIAGQKQVNNGQDSHGDGFKKKHK